MLKTTFLLVSVVASVALASSDVRADPDFTFIVPVQLDNLNPAIHSADVDCSMRIRVDSFDAATSEHGHTLITITNRRFSGDVRVTIPQFPRNAQSRPEDARFYTCSIVLNLTTPNGNGASALTDAATYQHLAGQNLTTATFKVNGDLKAPQKVLPGTVPVPTTPPPTPRK